MITEIYKALEEKFDAESFPSSDMEAPQPWIEVARDQLPAVCLFLREEPRFYFDFLQCLTGVDYGEKEGTVGVVYHLCSLTKGLHLVLKVFTERTLDPLPVVPSVREIWRTADWHEREAYDLVGIHFEGHPDLRRILLPEDWNGHPLRKDYQTDEEYHSIQIDY